MSTWLAHLRRINGHNVATFRAAPFAEISGSLGDLGTLLPLMIALALQGSIHLGSTLVFSGLFNVLTGAIFGIPLPVQPMKAIASAAISGPERSIGVVIAAGQYVGAAVLVLSATGLLRLATSKVPVPVVKGIQLGAGLSLIIGSGSSLQPLHWTHPVLDNRLWALLAFLVLIATQRLARFPYALAFFALSVLFAILRTRALPSFRLWTPTYVAPHWLGVHDYPALWMAIGQLPLTTLNSIIAVNALAVDLLPELPTPSATSIGLSVAVMNLTGTWLGGMPLCHGAGGLAAQHRFGARSGASVIFLGVLKMLLGLLFGETLIKILASYPTSILGVMVLAAGLELAKVGLTLNNGASDLWEGAAGQRRLRSLSDDERLERWTIMLMTTAGILAFRNDAVGFVAGMLCYCAYELAKFLDKRRGRLNAGERAPLISS